MKSRKIRILWCRFCLFCNFRKKLQEELLDFGKEVAIDGKIIQSYANKVSTKEPDGRREMQTDTTAKIYCSNNGTKTTKYYFGFQVHLKKTTA